MTSKEINAIDRAAMALEESYEIASLPSKDYVTYTLICRYQAKASRRLLDKLAELKLKSKQSSKKFWSGILIADSPFLDGFKKRKKKRRERDV